MKIFSNQQRAERIQQARSKSYDLIIIGGGVTGVGIALDASSRGLSCLLLEKTDFAAGTSSKSTKLIHGGLRYLKQLEIGLVRESGLERAIVHNNIPHLVHPERMLLPIVENGIFNKYTASLAIFVYDYLADVKAEDKRKSLTKTETLALEPLLDQKLVKSGILYAEYRTDDARLTIEILKAGVRLGAEAFNYMEVEDFLYDEGQVVGVKCLDKVSGQMLSFSAKQVVSAGGPWVDDLRMLNRSKIGKSLHLTKGVHLVIDHERFPLQQAIYFDDFAGRMIFAIPRGKVTYIGTSDTNYHLDKDQVVATADDVDYLLSACNRFFAGIALEKHDVVSTWAGLRPLIHEDGKSASDISRKDEIFESESNLISIAGGKLTGYRQMAIRVVDLVLAKHQKLNQVDSKTKTLKIHHDSFTDYHEFELFQEKLMNEENLDTQYAWYLASTYGKDALLILNKRKSFMDLSFDRALMKSEILYCIEFESVMYPQDYFERRSGKLFFDIESISNEVPFIIEVFDSVFNYSESQKNQLLLKAIKQIKGVNTFV